MGTMSEGHGEILPFSWGSQDPPFTTGFELIPGLH